MKLKNLMTMTALVLMTAAPLAQAVTLPELQPAQQRTLFGAGGGGGGTPSPTPTPDPSSPYIVRYEGQFLRQYAGNYRTVPGVGWFGSGCYYFDSNAYDVLHEYARYAVYSDGSRMATGEQYSVFQYTVYGQQSNFRYVHNDTSRSCPG